MNKLLSHDLKDCRASSYPLGSAIFPLPSKLTDPSVSWIGKPLIKDSQLGALEIFR
ncbi:hypothetical protein [Portibacter lacus]|uniref:hypothetical protein n=1 Tax=Portibacter lacus TaxID=1099794 RepID=UPI001F18CE79|nr:hypothetical protein [Portibacter lacus]